MIWRASFAPRRFCVFSVFCAARSTACPRHAKRACRYAQDYGAVLQPPSAASRSVLAFSPSTREASAVDLALKLNVLAVCAVFAFVGAILLGAF
jgi:hypothetical protein